MLTVSLFLNDLEISKFLNSHYLKWWSKTSNMWTLHINSTSSSRSSTWAQESLLKQFNFVLLFFEFLQLFSEATPWLMAISTFSLMMPHHTTCHGWVHILLFDVISLMVIGVLLSDQQQDLDINFRHHWCGKKYHETWRKPFFLNFISTCLGDQSLIAQTNATADTYFMLTMWSLIQHDQECV